MDAPEEKSSMTFIFIKDANHCRLFNYGCNIINKRFEEAFR
jgi:hypothetical protein